MASFFGSLLNLAICGMAAAYMYEKWQARSKATSNADNQNSGSPSPSPKQKDRPDLQLNRGLNIEVLGAQFDAPDSDGDSSVTVLFSAENTSKHDLERLITRIWFETDEGNLIGGGTAEMEESLSGEDSSSTSASLSLIRLGERTEGIRTHVSVIGCSPRMTKLEKRDLPKNKSGECILFQNTQIAEGVTIEKISATICETEDGAGQLKLFYLIRNETFKAFPQLELKTKLVSKTGKDLEFTETTEAIQPFSVGVVYDYVVLVKMTTLKNCQIECQAVIYEPVVIGEASGTSMAILEAEPPNEDEDDETDEEDECAEDASNEDCDDQEDAIAGAYPQLSSDAISLNKDTVAYLIFLSDNPEDIDSDDLGPLVYPDSDNAGAIHPPRGFGDAVLTEEQMAEQDGALPLEAVTTYMSELKEVLPSYFDVYGIHNERGFFVITLEEFLKLSKERAYSHIKVVELDNCA